MTIRIIVEQTQTGATVIQLSGRLVGEDALGELMRTIESNGDGAEIDLTDLRFADEKGVSALRSLREKGAKLVGVSPYFDLLMRVE